MIGALKSALIATLRSVGYEVRRAPRALSPEALQQAMAVNPQKHVMLVNELHGALCELLFPNLPLRSGRRELLARLVGTPLTEAMYLVGKLHEAQVAPGDVCEFGVAQGATSALLANEIKGSDRHLWVYDSFEGLPAPTKKDVLIDDIFGLGAIERYAGTMASPRQWVEARLTEIEFPAERTHIVAGFFNADSPMPDRVSFAYVDFDFYEPILTTLRTLWPRTSEGSIVVVDDYGFFSAGAKTAVDEFLAEAGDTVELSLPRPFAADSTPFCILRRTGKRA